MKDIQDRWFSVLFKVPAPLTQPHINGEFIEGMQNVMAYGARKHGEFTYMGSQPEAPTPREHIEAAMRHLQAALDGEQNDQDSGCPHIYHAATRIWLASREGVGGWEVREKTTTYPMRAPKYAYWYARDTIRGRWPEGESVIARDPHYAYYYARSIIKGRFPEGEKAIASNSQYAYCYAIDVIEGRWPEGEAAIATDPKYLEKYMNFVLADKERANDRS